MSKTIREWLEQLPEPYRSQAIWQTSEYELSLESDSLEESLFNMFPWRDAKEGYDYWNGAWNRARDGEFDRPAEQPPAFPDELSVLRANITKLAAENARLERENVRLQKLIDDPCGLLARAKQKVKYGCHCDLLPGQTPDGCVIDDNMPSLCVNAGRFLRKEECPEWRPIKQQDQ